ncbi:hypothetical protein C8Q75DRAFT_805555 [Abortiporus biennis]|nr:hypothetical protein C8Q75DRAFT_805555 [Abortiporus biennis]
MVRFKNRWILVEFIPCVSPTNSNNSSILAVPGLISSNNEITSKQIWSALKQSIIANFGDTGWGAVGSSLNIKYYSPTTNVCIIRVARDPYRIAWAGVTFLTSIDGKGYLPNVVHVSGTIKQAQMAAIQHNREVIARYRVLARTPGIHIQSGCCCRVCEVVNGYGQLVAYQDSYETFLKTSTEEIEALQD